MEHAFKNVLEAKRWSPQAILLIKLKSQIQQSWQPNFENSHVKIVQLIALPAINKIKEKFACLANQAFRTMELVFKLALLDTFQMLINVSFALLVPRLVKELINSSSIQLYAKTVMLLMAANKFKLIIRQWLFRNAFRIAQ